ncbi:hypothetical protein GCM10008955_01060 [Deinococcus malanensis]|uniref:Uncharacterized protein n=1 Tax=Deinococcus malanensis TaxID=1706855 RepID=A0ABQ2EHA0_9DEIO|nr:hypothetical protein [Deinococcus malanensis]GGK11626.1 hypothetical protein GCM10008955_01060 [Deinococcus malanensis]
MTKAWGSAYSHEVDLGHDQRGNPLKGYRQAGLDVNGLGLYFKTALQVAAQHGTNDVGLYLVYVERQPKLVLAGRLGDQVVKSEPAAEPFTEMAHQFVQAIRNVQTRQRHLHAS